MELGEWSFRISIIKLAIRSAILEDSKNAGQIWQKVLYNGARPAHVICQTLLTPARTKVVVTFYCLGDYYLHVPFFSFQFCDEHDESIGKKILPKKDNNKKENTWRKWRLWRRDVQLSFRLLLSPFPFVIFCHTNVILSQRKLHDYFRSWLKKFPWYTLYYFSDTYVKKLGAWLHSASYTNLHKVYQLHH